ncbi:MAG: L-seryl-tRNA(Sec) selenium transferase [Gemmatimonadales bacterium]
MSDPRRQLPAVDTVLAEPAVAALIGPHPRRLVVRAVREVLDAVRAQGGDAPTQGWAAVVRVRTEALAESSLLPVINATGVVLHTNLGRAPLAPAALRALTRVAAGYAALEYDLGRGTRGSRHAHCRNLLVDLTGAADALVVNNAAGALLLALSALGRGGEAVVSRGELVEIGGSFRIPDILTRSGATLVEVGTTNRTHFEDYRRAVGTATRLLLKVHRSNFQVTGFTTDVAARDLAALARERAVASVYDLGSGLLLDLTPWGLAGEPTVHAALASGVDLVVFSGDKLLGGPQAGIMLGTAPAIEACRSDPVARAVRADKLTLAALEATLALYRDPDTARREIPVLRMLTADLDVIRRRAEALREVVAHKAAARLIDGQSEVGGGSFPGITLPTVLVEVNADPLTADSLAGRLRSGAPPVIARIERERVLLDARTIADDQLESARRALAAALDG